VDIGGGSVAIYYPAANFTLASRTFMTQEPIRLAIKAPLPAEIDSFVAAENLGHHIVSFVLRRADTGRSAGSSEQKLATRRIYVFDNGFLYVDHAGPVSAYRPDQVSAVFPEIGVPVRQRHKDCHPLICIR
jgi:hypothetical protein